MKWVRRGLVYQPFKHVHIQHGVGFAQAPQALVLPDRIRIYFSTRTQDAGGKYLSHIAFVDFDRGMRQVLAHSERTVVPLGELGCFDEHGIFPMAVVPDGDRLLAYTTGWSRRISVSADAAIGLAISCDQGLTFQKVGTGPVMAAALREPFLVGDACVQKHGGLFHMWYIFGVRWTSPSESEPADRVYKIAHAVSQDGVNWDRDAQCIITDRLNVDECQALPTVLSWGGLYHMFFCYRESHGFRKDARRAYRIGYAYSHDLMSWVRDDARGAMDVSATGWDSGMQCYPHVFECDGEVYMLYNGNAFGREGFGLAVLDKGATTNESLVMPTPFT